jgi:hypothetical protein
MSGTHAGTDAAQEPVQQTLREKITVIIRAFLAAPRVLKIYPPGHYRVHAQADDLTALMGTLFAERHEPWSFAIRGMKIEVQGVRPEAAELSAAFALLLRRRQIGTITIAPGFTREEMEGLISLLAADYRQVLKTGGFDSFLPPEQHPHLRIAPLEDRAGGGPAFDVPARVVDAMQGAFGDAAILARMEALRSTMQEVAQDETTAEGAESFHALFNSFFGHPEWTTLDPQRIQRAFVTFLGLIEQALRMDDPESGTQIAGRISSVKSLFRNIASPSELAYEASQQDSQVVSVSYQVSGVQSGADEKGPDCSLVLMREVMRDESQTNALLALADTWVTDRTEQAQEVFVKALSDRRYSRTSIAQALRTTINALQVLPEAEAREFAGQALGATEDGEVLLDLITSIEDAEHPMVAGLLDSLSNNRQPFPLLAKLIQAPVADPVRDVLTVQLGKLARAKMGSFKEWANQQRVDLVKSEVLVPLVTHAMAAVAPACREIFERGSQRDKGGLIRALARIGTQNALHLLSFGLPQGDAPLLPQLTEAIAACRFPRAVALLAEIVEVLNERGEVDHAERVLRQIHGTRLVEARDVLWQVVTERKWLLARYSGRLRRTAQELLERAGS